jgi:DNA repair protein RAD51/DNA repair protein RadA
MADEIGDIKGVGSTTVDKLNRMGLNDIQELAKADPSLASEYPDVSMSEDRLEGIIEDAAANAIVIQSGDEVVDQYENITTRPSGISELDEKVGGFEARSLIAIGGSTGSGKTQLAFQALGEAVLDSGGKPAVYIETEPDRYRGGRIQQMFDKDVQSNVHKVSVGGEEALDMQYRSYKAVEEQFDDVSLVVVDSFTARFRLATKFDGRESLGKRNQEFSRPSGILSLIS